MTAAVPATEVTDAVYTHQYLVIPQTISSSSVDVNGTTADMADNPYKDMQGKTDNCQILMFLTDWTSTFRIKTSSKVFVDYDNDPGIIAFGALYSDKTDSEYVKFTIPLVYRSLDRIPNYVVVAGAASRYGDYFTGGVGSVLLLDEFEFVYDPAELTEAEYEAVFSNFN